MVYKLALLTLIAAAMLQSNLVYCQLPSAWTQGIATHYGGAQDGMNPSDPSFGTENGACGFGNLNPDIYPYWSVGALSPSNKFAVAGPSLGCGQCFEVQCLNSGGQYAGRCGTSQSIVITITDTCPECETNHLDIQALTFNKLAPMSIGRIDIQFRRVDCTPPLPVSIEIDNNVGVGGWLRLVVEKTAGFGGITSVDIRTTGTQSWLKMNNKFGSAWEVTNAPGLPWDFQFTSDSTQQIVANSLVMQNGQIGNIPTGVQFSLSGSSSGANISYDSQGPSAPAGPVPPTTTAASPPGAGAAATNPPPSSACKDTQPTAFATCQQQKDWGKCQESWMTSNSFCQLTCGACSASSGGSATPPAAAGAIAASTGVPPAAAANASETSGQVQPAVASGGVQTYSVSASPPSTPPSSPTPSPTPGSNACSDNNPPPGASGNCASIANPSSCSQSILPPYCASSCYRCPSSGR